MSNVLNNIEELTILQLYKISLLKSTLLQFNFTTTTNGKKIFIDLRSYLSLLKKEFSLKSAVLKISRENKFFNIKQKTLKFDINKIKNDNGIVIVFNNSSCKWVNYIRSLLKLHLCNILKINGHSKYLFGPVQSHCFYIFGSTFKNTLHFMRSVLELKKNSVSFFLAYAVIQSNMLSKPFAKTFLLTFNKFNPTSFLLLFNTFFKLLFTFKLLHLKSTRLIKFANVPSASFQPA